MSTYPSASPQQANSNESTKLWARDGDVGTFVENVVSNKVDAVAIAESGRPCRGCLDARGEKKRPTLRALRSKRRTGLVAGLGWLRLRLRAGLLSTARRTSLTRLSRPRPRPRSRSSSRASCGAAPACSPANKSTQRVTRVSPSHATRSLTFVLLLHPDCARRREGARRCRRETSPKP
eukprot:scaffold7079_cov154-Pinguiococcus_pyrenoidosus.AAC.7